MTPLEWSMVIVGCFLVGLGKGGLPGAGNLTVVLFASVFEPKASVGILLPILVSADIVAITVYRRHAEWRYLKILLPWMFLGIFLGYFTFGALSSDVVKKLIGGIVLLMTLIQIGRMWLQQGKGKDLAERIPHSLIYRGSLGLIGGFATMIANAAGPVAQMYFISVGLPKMVFIGTAAWCFFIVNAFKVPLQAHLGIIHLHSLQTSLTLAPVAMLGVLIAPKIVHHIPQKIFTFAIWFFIIVAGIKLLLF